MGAIASLENESGSVEGEDEKICIYFAYLSSNLHDKILCDWIGLASDDRKNKVLEWIKDFYGEQNTMWGVQEKVENKIA
jgi:hypothetical protein